MDLATGKVRLGYFHSVLLELSITWRSLGRALFIGYEPEND
jgi:hypothetical protein